MSDPEVSGDRSFVGFPRRPDGAAAKGLVCISLSIFNGISVGTMPWSYLGVMSAHIVVGLIVLRAAKRFAIEWKRTIPRVMT
jgi:hypothetical protein